MTLTAKDGAVNLQASPNGCQEASLHSHGTYVPCNAPAEYVVDWAPRKDAAIRMCVACADHNVKNRGGRIVSRWERVAEDSRVVQQEDTRSAAAVTDRAGSTPAPATIADLVQERQRLKNWLEAEEKRFSDHVKPTRDKVASLDAQCQELMLAQGVKSLRTDHGTAIVSERSTARIIATERDAYLDFCLDKWDEGGSDMLQLGAPQADAVRHWMAEHEGQLPPHVEISTMLTFSVRKV